MSKNKPKSRIRITPSDIAVRIGIGIVGIVMITFITAGRLDYWQGWLYCSTTTLVLIITPLALSQKPDLIKERLRPGPGMKWWDKIYFALSSPLYFATFVLAPLDAGRFRWSPPLSPRLVILVSLLYLAGHVIFLWAKYANKFFSSVVRIQRERKQTVCQSGPYAYVRHPGYVGGSLFIATTPLILGSLWALIPAGIAVALLVIRAYLEDNTLKKELPGYRAYARNVKYRLIPRVW